MSDISGAVCILPAIYCGDLLTALQHQHAAAAMQTLGCTNINHGDFGRCIAAIAELESAIPSGYKASSGPGGWRQDRCHGYEL